MNYDKIITKYDMKLKNDKIDWNMTNELSKNKIDEARLTLSFNIQLENN